MSNSHRHHYIPKFLIENFINNDGSLYVYDKQSDTIRCKGPKSVFFEWDRNNRKINGIDSSKLEDIYSDIDNLLAPVVRKIISSDQMTAREQGMLILLADIIRWRVPQSDAKFDELKSLIPIEELGLSYVPHCSQEQANESMLESAIDRNFLEDAKRILLPTTIFSNQPYYEEVQKGCFIVSQNYIPNLLGDCGIIEDELLNINQLGSLFLPISSTHTFVYKKGAVSRTIENQELFSKLINILIYMKSEKYVACKSKEFLCANIEFSKTVPLKFVKDLTAELFSYIK